ncbi:flagellar basal body P-ring formation chaperone FlgA [Desulfoplanes sp.]
MDRKMCLRCLFLCMIGLLTWGAVIPAGTNAAVGQDVDRIVFHEFVCVPGENITLGDLAVANGPESSVYMDHFGSVSVAPAPSRPGHRVIVTGAMIRQALEKAAPVPGACELPYQIQVQRGGRVAGGREIKQRVDKFLTNALAPLKGETVVREYRIPDHIFMDDPEGELGMECPRGVDPGRVSFRINVVGAHGTIARRISASVFVDVWVTVPCANRPLARDRRIGPGEVRFERKNLAYLRSGVWNGRGGPWRVVRPMGTGEVVYEKNIELLPDVIQGARVSLVYDGETIRLEVPAEVMEDGRVGRTVTVRNLQSNKQVLARVKDKNTVVVN